MNKLVQEQGGVGGAVVAETCLSTHLYGSAKEWPNSVPTGPFDWWPVFTV